MTSCIHVSLILILATILPEIVTGDNEKCRKTFHSVEVVASCPTTKNEYDIAARRKNCSKLHFAANKMCMSGKIPYVYHCVINEFTNETLEVCAQEKTIFGFCTELNVGGEVIQRHAQGQCNNVFPKCEEKYISSDAYKYPDCYKLVYENQALKSTLSHYPNSSAFETRTVSFQDKTTINEKNHKINPTLDAVLIVVATCIVFCTVFVCFLILLLRKNLWRSERRWKRDLEDDLMQPIDYIYISAKHFDHFQYVYKLTRNCTHRLVNVCTKVDLSDFMSEDVYIRIGVVGDFTEENLNLLSKGKVKRYQQIKKNSNIWKTALLLCFQKHHSSKSAIESLRKGHACHRILIQSEESIAKTKKADDPIITVCHNKQQIKNIITTCFEKQLDQILQVWLGKLNSKGSLKQTSKMIAEINAIRKQLILESSKKTAASDIPCINKSIVPNDVKEYLFRQFYVNSFGIWGRSTIQIFVKKGTDDKILKSKLIKMNPNFFAKYHCKIETRNTVEKQTMRQYDPILLMYNFGETFQKVSIKPYDEMKKPQNNLAFFDDSCESRFIGPCMYTARGFRAFKIKEHVFGIWSDTSEIYGQLEINMPVSIREPENDAIS